MPDPAPSDGSAFKPAGYPTVVPYLVVPKAGDLIAFLSAVFSATEIMRECREDGSIWHAQIRIDDAVLMLSDANEDNPAMPGLMYVYVADVTTAYETALAAGAESLMPPTDMEYGDCNAGVRDANGISWWIATRKAVGGYRP